MNLPNDPFMLLSVINTKLRDFYKNLDNLCEDTNINKEELCARLKAAGFEYDKDLNKFR